MDDSINSSLPSFGKIPLKIHLSRVNFWSKKAIENTIQEYPVGNYVL